MPQLYHERAVPELIKLARDLKVKYILCVGDVFDKPKPEQRTKDFLLKNIVENEDIHFIFTVGNHDYETKAKSYHSLEYLDLLKNDLPNVTVLEPGGYTEPDEFPFLLTVLKEWEDVYSLDGESSDSRGPEIVAWHGMLPGMDFSNKEKTKECVFTEIENARGKSNVDYIALGDIHKRLYPYPGALVQKTFGCEDGLISLRFTWEESGQWDIQVQSVRLDLPKKHTLKISFTEGTGTEHEIIAFVKENVEEGQFVKLKFSIPLSAYSSINKEIVCEGLADYCLDIVMENDPILETTRRKSADKIAKAKTMEEEVDILIEEDSYGLDKGKLKKFCKPYLKEKGS